MASKPSTLFDLIQAIPADRTAVILPEPRVRVTYGALGGSVERLARALAAAGVRRGDRVAIALPNGLPLIVAVLAAALTGTAVPLNAESEEEAFRFRLEGVKARVLISDGASAVRRAAADGVRFLAIDLEHLLTADPVRSASTHRSIPPSADDVAMIVYTSGRTGPSKCVPLSHANLSISAQNIASSYALDPEDVSLCVMPLHDLHGLVASTLAAFASGGAVVVPGRFNPLSFWRIARDHRVTWYSAAPSIHQMLLARTADPGVRMPARLRFIRSCGAALPQQVGQTLESSFGAPVLEAYAATEAAHQIASNPPPPAERKAGSVGRATGMLIRIMDPGGGHVSAGESGEIVISGPNLTKGYEGNPDATAAAFADGWFRTGDCGCLDADGYLKLTGPLEAQEVTCERDSSSAPFSLSASAARRT